MKTKSAILAIIAVLAMNFSVAHAGLITDLESGNPFQAWGVGDWQNRTQQIVTDYTPEIGQTGNWMELGVGAWGNQDMLIIPRWGEGVWDTWNASVYNQHSSIGFDAIMFAGDDDMSWPTSGGNALIFRLGRDGTNIPQVTQDFHWLDLTNLWQTIQLDPEDPESTLTYIYAHFSVPYTDIDPFQVPNADADFQGYFRFSTTGGNGTIYLDNFALEGPPLPVPEPTTIALLAMTGLMGLLYWRKR